MLKGVKVRLYPDDVQTNNLNKLLGSCRFVYNHCLDFKILNYQTDKTNISFSDLGHYFHQDLRNNNEWLKEHNTKVLKQAIINLDSAYKNFFKQNKGFPKFKAKHDEQKARFPKEAISKKTFDEETSKLNLTTTVKGLKFKCSDRDKRYLYKNKESIKSITITKTKTGKYFASILVDGDLLRVMHKPINGSIGIDLGIKTLMVFSNGETIDNPKWIRSNEKQLKKLQKQLSKKEKGSNNRDKARLKLAKKYEKINNQKRDFTNNLTTKIINENQVIILEDLNVSGMMQNYKLAKSIQELSLYEIRRQLEYKAKWYGRELIIIDRWFPSSKLCSECGYKKTDLTLKDREWTCPSCGKHHDRDLNAAINIENEGLRLLNKEKIGQRLPEFTLEDNPTMDDKEFTPLKSRATEHTHEVGCGWMIQENDDMYNFVQV